MQQDSADAASLAEYRLAIVAAEAVVFGMARMYQTRAQDVVPNVRVFRTMEEAGAWLGLAQ